MAEMKVLGYQKRSGVCFTSWAGHLVSVHTQLGNASSHRTKQDPGVFLDAEHRPPPQSVRRRVIRVSTNSAGIARADGGRVRDRATYGI